MNKKREKRLIRITGIHKEDSFYKSRERYIGKTGMFRPDIVQNTIGYFSGWFDDMYFFAIRYRRI